MSERTVDELLHDLADAQFFADNDPTVAVRQWRCGCGIWHVDSRPVARVRCRFCKQAALLFNEGV